MPTSLIQHGACPFLARRPVGHVRSSRPGLGTRALCPPAGSAGGMSRWGRRPRPLGRSRRTVAPADPVGSAAGDKVASCPAGRNLSPYPPHGSGATPESCPCGGTACAARPARSRRPCTPAGLFTEDRRRPIAQWYNPAPARPCWWRRRPPRNGPCSGSAIFYAPPGAGFTRVHSAPHEWHPRGPRKSPTEQEAFQAAVAEAATLPAGGNVTSFEAPSAEPTDQGQLPRPKRCQTKKVPQPVFTGRGYLSAPPAGLEPATLRLTVECSAN